MDRETANDVVRTVIPRVSRYSLESKTPQEQSSRAKCPGPTHSPSEFTTSGFNDWALLDDFPELRATAEEDQLLGLLVDEVDCDDAERSNEGGKALRVEWVVDIADKDNDWFVATAYGYREVEQTVYVMVPDRDAPTWAGDVPLNPLAVRLLECCDGRSIALFKQLVRESALEVDWDLRIHRPAVRDRSSVEAPKSNKSETDEAVTPHDDLVEGAGTPSSMAADLAAVTEVNSATATFSVDSASVRSSPGALVDRAVTDARATVLIPLGNFVVIEEGSCKCVAEDDAIDTGGLEAGTAAIESVRKLVRLDERIELVNCRGAGGPGEEAFFRLAEEGLVAYDPMKVNWRAYKGSSRMRRQDKRRLGSLAPSSSSAIAALIAAVGVDGSSSDDRPIGAVLRDVGGEIRSLVRRTLDLRDDLLTEHLATLRRFRRFVLDGNLDDGAALMEQATEACVGVLDDRHVRDKERITIDAVGVEKVLCTIADRTQGTVTRSAGECDTEGVATIERNGALVEERISNPLASSSNTCKREKQGNEADCHEAPLSCQQNDLASFKQSGGVEAAAVAEAITIQATESDPPRAQGAEDTATPSVASGLSEAGGA